MPDSMGGEPTDAVAAAAVAAERSTPLPRKRGLLANLCCPQCRSTAALIANRGAELRCPDCETCYPIVACGAERVPWLFRRPDIARLEWSARYKSFLHRNTVEHNRLNRALDPSLESEAARRRIVAKMKAHREHRNQISSILAPLELDGDVLVPAITETLGDKLPNNQALTSYAANVFRDWAWSNGENEALLGAVEAVLDAESRSCNRNSNRPGSLLTLGAGACRLSYDMHRKLRPETSVALDFNPLLLLIGCRVINGEVLSLIEFPRAGIGDDASGVLHHCRAPSPLTGGSGSDFHFVLGDATNPPFRSGSFETVVTPWLLDIVSQDLRQFLPQINRLLPIDGIFVNTGPLAFHNEDPRRCYGEDEVFEIVEQCGFKIERLDHRKVPYLQSPHSAHGRIERLVTFAARKVEHVVARPAPATLPDWLLDPALPIPGSAERVVESSSYLLTAQILAAIDGKRSIEAIAEMVAREYNLSLDECVVAVTRVLVDIHEGVDSSQMLL